MKRAVARRDGEVNALATIAAEMLGLTEDVDSILTLITRKTRQFLNCDTSHITLFDEKTKESYVKAYSGVVTEKFKKLKAPAGEGLADWVLRERKPAICSDYATDPRRSPSFLDGVEKEGLKQLLGVPLFLNSDVTGVLFACNRSKNASFSTKHVELASAFANLASVALQNARLYHEQRRMLAKLEALNERLAYSNRLLKHASSIHEQFIMAELRNEGATTIAQILAELIGNPVLVEDHRGELLAVSQYKQNEYSESLRDIASLSIVNLAKDKNGIDKKLKLLKKEKRHLWLPKISEGSIIRRRLVAPIVVENEILGYVSGLEAGRKLGELDVVATQYAALVLALNLTKQRAVFEAEQRAKGDFVGSLISGDYTSKDHILRRAAYMGYDLTGPRRVIVMRLDNLPCSAETSASEQGGLSKLLDRISQAVDKLLSSINRESITAIQKDEIVVLAICEGYADGYSSDRIIDQVATAIKRAPKQIVPGLTASVGVGCICNELSDYSKSYDEARRALDIASWAGKKDEIVPLSALGIYGVLFEPHSYKKLFEFSQKVLDPLVRHDQKHTSQLVRTLLAFFNNDCSSRRTASMLFIHENTLRQRLQRIEELCQIHLNDADDKFSLQLALKIRELSNAK